MSPAGEPSEDILRQFLSFLKYDRTLSDNTVLSYGRDIAKYFRFLESERTAWDRAREADLVKFIHGQSRDGLSPRSMARLISALKAFYRFLILDRRVAKDPTAQIPKIQAAFDETSRLFRTQGESELRLFGFPDAAGFYADGQRSILEIRDAVAAEYAPIPIEALVLYFRAFEKAGVLKILEK